MKVLAWIHPRKGDDYQVEMEYNGIPSDADIMADLKGMGSIICTDFARL